MLRFRTLSLLSAVLVLGACSETSAPSGPTDSDATLRRSEASAARSSYVGETSAPRAAGQRVEHSLSCNFAGTCIQIHPHYFNGTSRVYSQADMNRTGCGVFVRFYRNGNLVFTSGSGCFGRNAIVFYAVRGPSRRGDVLCARWFNIGRTASASTRCQVR